MQDQRPRLTGLPTTPETLIYDSDGQFLYTAVCCPTREHRGLIATTSNVPAQDLGCRNTVSVTIDDQYVPLPGNTVAQTTADTDFLAGQYVGAVSGDKTIRVRNRELYLATWAGRYVFSQNVGEPLRDYSFRIHQLRIPLGAPGSQAEVYVADDSQEIVGGGRYREFAFVEGSLRLGVRQVGIGESSLFRLQATFNSPVKEFYIILRKARTR